MPGNTGWMQQNFYNVSLPTSVKWTNKTVVKLRRYVRYGLRGGVVWAGLGTLSWSIKKIYPDAEMYYPTAQSLSAIPLSYARKVGSSPYYEDVEFELDPSGEVKKQEVEKEKTEQEEMQTSKGAGGGSGGDVASVKMAWSIHPGTEGAKSPLHTKTGKKGWREAPVIIDDIGSVARETYELIRSGDLQVSVGMPGFRQLVKETTDAFFPTILHNRVVQASVASFSIWVAHYGLYRCPNLSRAFPYIVKFRIRRRFHVSRTSMWLREARKGHTVKNLRTTTDLNQRIKSARWLKGTEPEDVNGQVQWDRKDNDKDCVTALVRAPLGVGKSTWCSNYSLGRSDHYDCEVFDLSSLKKTHIEKRHESVLAHIIAEARLHPDITIKEVARVFGHIPYWQTLPSTNNNWITSPRPKLVVMDDVDALQILYGKSNLDSFIEEVRKSLTGSPYNVFLMMGRPNTDLEADVDTNFLSLTYQECLPYIFRMTDDHEKMDWLKNNWSQVDGQMKLLHQLCKAGSTSVFRKIVEGYTENSQKEQESHDRELRDAKAGGVKEIKQDTSKIPLIAEMTERRLPSMDRSLRSIQMDTKHLASIKEELGLREEALKLYLEQRDVKETERHTELLRVLNQSNEVLKKLEEKLPSP